MHSTSILQNHNEVQILLPTVACIKEYRFKEVITKTSNNRLTTKTTTKTVKICFSGMEDNLWRYQLLCVNLEIEAKHMGSTSILRKQLNVFDEVIVQVTHNGTIVALLNHKDLQKRWQEVKEELLEKHQGSALLDLLADTDELMDDKKKLLKFIASKEMYGLYFNGCWGYHDITKPRFEGLVLNIEKRIQYDQHTKHLQKPYSQDVQIVFKAVQEKKVQESEFTYKKNQLIEAFLAIEEPNINAKYSIICLTT
jgi:hypothetical protein